MRTKLAWALALGCLIFAFGCSGSDPSVKVKEFVNLAGKRDVEGMLKMMPKGEGEELRTRERNMTLVGDADLIVVALDGVTSIDILKETVTDKTATVETSVLGVAYPKPVIYRFQLQNEKGEWNILDWKRVDNSH